MIVPFAVAADNTSVLAAVTVRLDTADIVDAAGTVFSV
jgi:hypothetical protein